MSSAARVHIVGAGLAGCEAAWFLAQRGVAVVLHEMRPGRLTAAHKSGNCAELVCSNSFKSKSPASAAGMMKSEMTQLGSLILRTATESEVPAGEALGVDREVFSEKVTRQIRDHRLITWSEGEISGPFPGEVTLLATGPLTSDGMGKWLAEATGQDDLYFYDAIAPIVDAATIDPARSFLANRYDKGDEEAYLNCPLDEAEYYAFIEALLSGEKVPPRNFEKEVFFQGCQPIEAIAASGRDSMRFGPMKPVGLSDPRTGQRPFAVVQLRPENRARTAYNIVGFQTKLKYGEQSRIFRMIPALKSAEFLRLGSIHRNTYVCGPKVLRPDLSLRGHPLVYVAGQVSGVEGYLESAACGLLAGVFILQRLTGNAHLPPPPDTALGSLLRHVVAGNPKNYQPANMHFGLFDPLYFDGVAELKRDGLREAMVRQSGESSLRWKTELEGLHGFRT